MRCRHSGSSKSPHNVQPVTETFFKDYKAAYDATAAELDGQITSGDAAAYAKTLFNRLLFVHFVSRKGWLSFNGCCDYLNALRGDYWHDPAQTNFYASRLDALFHDGMNAPPEQRRRGIDQSYRPGALSRPAASTAMPAPGLRNINTPWRIRSPPAKLRHAPI